MKIIMTINVDYATTDAVQRNLGEHHGDDWEHYEFPTTDESVRAITNECVSWLGSLGIQPTFKIEKE